MTTDEYIETLRLRKKQRVAVAMRQALAYYCYKNNIQVQILAQIFKISRTMIYKYIYSTRDLLDANDKLMKRAMDEVNAHSLIIQPYSIQGKMIFMHGGYKLVIDNKIF